MLPDTLSPVSLFSPLKQARSATRSPPRKCYLHFHYLPKAERRISCTVQYVQFILCCAVEFRFESHLRCIRSLPPPPGSVWLAVLCSQLPVPGDISLQVCSPSWLSQMRSGGRIHLKVLPAPLSYSLNALLRLRWVKLVRSEVEGCSLLLFYTSLIFHLWAFSPRNLSGESILIVQWFGTFSAVHEYRILYYCMCLFRVI